MHESTGLTESEMQDGGGEQWITKPLSRRRKSKEDGRTGSFQHKTGHAG